MQLATEGQCPGTVVEGLLARLGFSDALLDNECSSQQFLETRRSRIEEELRSPERQRKCRFQTNRYLGGDRIAREGQ